MHHARRHHRLKRLRLKRLRLKRLCQSRLHERHVGSKENRRRGEKEREAGHRMFRVTTEAMSSAAWMTLEFIS